MCTRLRRPWLDGAIARGVDRPVDRALALREAQLTGAHERRRLAGRFEELLAARTHPAAFSAAVPVDHEAVSVAKPVLTELVLALRSSDPVQARGVALGWRLFTDACSPVFASPQSGNLDRLWYESLRLLFALRPLPEAKATRE